MYFPELKEGISTWKKKKKKVHKYKGAFPMPLPNAQVLQFQ